MVTTLTARRAQVHQAYMVEHTTAANLTFTQAVHAMAVRLATAGLDATTATHQAYGRVYRLVIGQASTLAYIDTYWILAVGAAIMFLLSFALKKNQPGAGELVIG
jgi:MFS transporter, DHA2 family, multidrug resistance protein